MSNNKGNLKLFAITYLDRLNIGRILKAGLSPSPFCSTARRLTVLSKNLGAKTGFVAIFGFPSTGLACLSPTLESLSVGGGLTGLSTWL